MSRTPRDPSSQGRLGEVHQELKDRQIAYFRDEVDEEFEIERPGRAGRLYNYLMSYKLNSAIDRMQGVVRENVVLNICCGSGMDLEFMARAKARVIGLDLSKEAVRRARERARRHGFEVKLVVGDAEHLPFRDEAVAVAFVHDGLHHLPDPHRAIRELVRVSRKAVALIEPANGVLSRLAVMLGVSQEYEDAGNYIYRLSVAELVSLFHSLGIRPLTVRRYVMYYHHEPRWYYRIFDHTIPFRIFQGLFLAVNLLLGRWGNKMMCMAVKGAEATVR